MMRSSTLGPVGLQKFKNSVRKYVVDALVEGFDMSSEMDEDFSNFKYGTTGAECKQNLQAFISKVRQFYGFRYLH